MLLFPDTVVATVFSSEYERIFASTLVSTAQRKLCCEMFPIGCFFSRLYLDVSLIPTIWLLMRSLMVTDPVQLC